MIKKIVGIFIMTLLITTAIPAVESMNDSKTHLTLQCMNQADTGEDWSELAKLLPSDGAEHDYFGESVSIYRDYAVIGAKNYQSEKLSVGSAFIFKYDGASWTQQAKLLPSETIYHFGCSVSINGDYVLIGADNETWGYGSAYVFKRTGTTWTQQEKLLPSEPINSFGYSVSLYNEYALIGAPNDDDNGEGSGSAYIFKRTGTTWSQEAKLHASDGAEFDHFGVSVSIYGDIALIGAWFDDDNGDDSGSAYIFNYDGASWTQQVKLLPSDWMASWFGRSVSLYDNYALIGASGYKSNTGEAFIFKRTGTIWSEEAKLKAQDGNYLDYFGNSVSIYLNYALIGAYGDEGQIGSAYVFKRDGTIWTQRAKLLASDNEGHDRFGNSVSIYGNTALIGADGDNYYGINSGSAYIFIKSGGNQPPTVEITYPSEGQIVSDSITITGTANDFDGTVQQVEVKIDNGNWWRASGTTSWSYEWDTTMVTNGYHTIYARSYDGEDYSLEDSVNVNVKNGDLEINGLCPVDLNVIDANGRNINKTSSNIPGATYTEEDLDGDGDLDDKVFIPNAIDGLYTIEVTPESDAEPTDTFSIRATYNGATYYLAEDVMIKDIPPGGYVFSWPNKPATPDGPTTGKAGETYTYTSSTMDPDGDQIYYLFNWDDGTNSGWIETGEASHTWTVKGSYEIKVKAKDIHDFESDWSDPLIITITKNKSRAINTLFLQFFNNFLDNHPNLLQVLQKIIQRLGQ